VLCAAASSHYSQLKTWFSPKATRAPFLVLVALLLFIAWTPEIRGQVTFDAASSTDTGSGSAVSRTFSHTTSGSDRILIVGVSIFRNSSQSVSSVTYAGTGLTYVGSSTYANEVRTEIWRLMAPATGANNIVVTLSSSAAFVAGASSFTGVHQTTPLGSFFSATNDSGNPSVNVTGVNTGEVVIDTLGVRDITTATVGAGQTQRWNRQTTGDKVVGAGSTEPRGGSSTVTMSWSLSDQRKWAIGAVALKPAPQLPDLTITKSHSGNFTQGQVGATYSITPTNSGPGATSGTVTVTDTLPGGLTATAINGTGWSCVLGTLTCTRSDVLAAGASYPVITLTVDVANNAPASVTNTAGVSGGGQTNTANDTASDPTTINQLPDLTIAKSHAGNFIQGQVGATYTITVTNSGFSATDGSTVTVSDTLPAGLTVTAISGGGWTCVLGTLECTRNEALAAGLSYPVITLTVDVALTAPGSVTNSASVSGGGETNVSNNTANDPTTIDSATPPSVTLVKSVNPNGAQAPSTDLTYTIVYTNGGGQPAATFVLVDPDLLNVDPLERVFHNVDFKVGSMVSAPGTTGLVATFEYSNDGAATWTYTPVSGGGGAPAGYDRNVTNVRWVFAGSLSSLAPNNTGSVDFIVRIR
jgi:uncharacterized repeat protein (TIGR01451 family)